MFLAGREFGGEADFGLGDRVGDGATLGRELALQLLLMLDRDDGVVHAEHLMVAGDNLPRAAGAAVIEQDEVLYQVEQALFREHPVEQHLGLHAALFLFIVPLPLGEMLPLARDGAVAGAVAVAHDEEGVVVERVVDARLAQVIGQVVVEARPHVQIDRLEFNEDERQAVDEADQIGAAVVVRHAQALNLQFPHGQEAVVWRAVGSGAVAEINDAGAGVPGLPRLITPLDRDAIADEVVELAVVLDERPGEVHPRELLDGPLAGGFGQVGIEPMHGGAEVAGEDDIPLAGAAQRANGAEGLLVVREDALPAEDIMKVVGERLLDEPVFIVDVGDHGGLRRVRPGSGEEWGKPR